MHSSRMITCSVVIGLLLSAVPAWAQVSADGMGKVIPVELYACNFMDGKSNADLAAVVDRWNEYSDDNDMDDYAAWLLTPFFYTAEQDFDIIWLGAFKDGNAMGAGLQDWVTNGQEMAAAFAEVVDCNAHVAFSSSMYKAPVGGNTPDSGFISMMDCKLNEGFKYSDVKAAELKWMGHLNKTGSKAGYYHWRPMFGGGEADFDYKVVTAYPDFVELGSDWEKMANGGGRDVSMEIFEDIDECNDARVYVTKSIRSAKIRD